MFIANNYVTSKSASPSVYPNYTSGVMITCTGMNTKLVELHKVILLLPDCRGEVRDITDAGSLQSLD